MEEINPEKEKRVSQRKAYRRVAYLLDASQSPMKIRTLDISLSGLSLISQKNFPLSTSLTLHIDLPTEIKGSNTSFKVQLQVMNSIFSSSEDGFRIGLKFLSPTSPLMTSILQILKT